MSIGRGCTDTQAAARLDLPARDLALGLDQLPQCLPALLVIGLAGCGQAHLPGGADEQAHAQALFQARHAAADRRRRNAGLRGRGSEAAAVGGQAEQFQAAQLQVIEMAGHDGSIDYMVYRLKCPAPHFSSAGSNLQWPHTEPMAHFTGDHAHEHATHRHHYRGLERPGFRPGRGLPRTRRQRGRQRP
ncbi:hypothetical protein D3C75_856880 [compost metagenome]